MADRDLRAIYMSWLEAWAALDVDAIAAGMTEDFKYTVPGDNILAGVHNGQEGWRALVRKAAEESDHTRDFATKDILAGDDHVAALFRATGKRRGRELDIDVLVVYRFVGDQMAEGTMLPLDMAAFDAFWSR